MSLLPASPPPSRDPRAGGAQDLAAAVVRALSRAVVPILWLDRRFTTWAARLSHCPEIVRLDRWVFWFPALCALLFGGMAALGLHGSSLDQYSSKYAWSEVRAAPLLGQACNIRSDEWALQTPLFLNQAFRLHPYATEVTSCGRQNAVLLFNTPCQDFTQVFRPQYWAFHFLTVETAFSIYWQAKGFILLTGVFSLLLLLSRGRGGLAALGAWWFFFSAHMQWAYSWASMLPEMVGCFGWTICLTCFLCVGRNPWLLAAAAIGCVFSALDFALCCYPPHQIPFALFGALLVPAWVWTHRAAVFNGDAAHRRWLALAISWGTVAAVLVVFALEAREALAAAANTVYPGQRIAEGGDVPLKQLVSHFLDFWKTEFHFPYEQGNICEGTGFLWLLPVTPFMWGRQRPVGAGQGWMLAACWGAAGIIAVWMTCPIPSWVGRWLLLDHVITSRCYPALGLVNVAGVIVSLSLRARARPTAAAAASRFSWLRVLAIFVGVAGMLLLMNDGYLWFFRWDQLVLGTLYATVLIVCLLERRQAALAVALLVPLVLVNGLVNPLDRGFPVVTRSALFKTVQGNPRLREGRWLVYSQDFALTGFVVATGADVFNSFKVLPDLRAMGAFDPAGRFRRACNQSGLTMVRALPEGRPAKFDDRDAGLLRWSVSPLDPALRQAGIRFVAFDEPPDPRVAARLKPVAVNVPGMFIYELP